MINEQSDVHNWGAGHMKHLPADLYRGWEAAPQDDASYIFDSATFEGRALSVVCLD